MHVAPRMFQSGSSFFFHSCSSPGVVVSSYLRPPLLLSVAYPSGCSWLFRSTHPSLSVLLLSLRPLAVAFAVVALLPFLFSMGLVLLRPLLTLLFFVIFPILPRFACVSLPRLSHPWCALFRSVPAPALPMVCICSSRSRSAHPSLPRSPLSRMPLDVAWWVVSLVLRSVGAARVRPGGRPWPGFVVLGAASCAVVVCVWYALSGFAARGGRCSCLLVLCGGCGRGSASGVPLDTALVTASHLVQSLSVCRSLVPLPWYLPLTGALASGFTGRQRVARGGKPRTGPMVPAAGAHRGKGAGLALRCTRSGLRNGVFHGGFLRHRSLAACGAVDWHVWTRSLTLPVDRTSSFHGVLGQSTRAVFVLTRSPPLLGRRMPRPGHGHVCVYSLFLDGSRGPASGARFSDLTFSCGRSRCVLCFPGPLRAQFAVLLYGCPAPLLLFSFRAALLRGLSVGRCSGIVSPYGVLFWFFFLCSTFLFLFGCFSFYGFPPPLNVFFLAPCAFSFFWVFFFARVFFGGGAEFLACFHPASA